MSYVRIARMYWKTGRDWHLTWYEISIEICFAWLWYRMGLFDLTSARAAVTDDAV